MRLILLFLAALLWPGGWQDAPRPPAQPTPAQSTPAKPTLRLEKTRFMLGERVFFWVGVSGPDSYRFPRSLQTSGRLTITRPDGSERVDEIGWHMDGPGDRGWEGGHGLGSEPQQVGRYRLVFEFAGQKSPPASFTIEDLDVVERITAAFVFSSPLVLDSSDGTATLRVHNGTTEIIQFPHRGELAEYVGAGLSKTTGTRWESSFFVPNETLLWSASAIRSNSGEDRFTWDLADRVATVRVAPGDTYELRLPIRAVMEGHGLVSIPVGEYDLRLSTTLQTLIGSREGAWKDFAPVRIDVSTTTRAIKR